MEKKLPHIMVVAINAWREDATSHTLMNIFSCWQPSKLSMVYTRSDKPNTAVCSRFFQISENDVLKSIYKPDTQTGREVCSSLMVDEPEVKAEHERYAKARKKHSYVMTICREVVWFLGHWKSKELREFVKDVNPDILFIPIYPTVYMGWVQRYIKKITNKPMVCYLADDNYSYLSCSGFLSYMHRFFLRRQVKYLSTNCEEMFVIVDKEKEETDRLFGTDSVILTKGINFNSLKYEEHTVNKPLKFVYTGNLIIGREKTLVDIADALNCINQDGIKATLDIYSPDLLDKKIMNQLNSGCSKHRGFIQREKVSEILKDADVVIFAEALEGKSSNAARLSFSTKITDYLLNGKCILAVGKENIAPIDYFKINDSAIVVTCIKNLVPQIQKIINNPELISIYGKKAFECARCNHEKNMMDKRFIETICRVAGKD